MTIRKSNGLVVAEAELFATIMGGGVLKLYSGAQPATASAGETGVLLGVVTQGGATHTPGSATNGLALASSGNGIVGPAEGWAWRGVFIADGTVGYFRHYDVDAESGVSTTAARWDGAVGVTGSGATLEIDDVNAITGKEFVVNSFSVVYPK